MASQDVKSSKTPSSSPVELLNTTIAQSYTHIHPVLVLALFWICFKQLVQDPVATMISTAPALCLLQAIYMALCLPLSTSVRPSSLSSATSTTKSPQPSNASQRKKQTSSKTSPSVFTRISSTLLSLLLTVSITVPVLTTMLILHGAPFTMLIPHTLLAALHLALLATPSLFYTHGVSSSKWRELISLAAPIDELLGAMAGTCLGAWLGAVPIPLDWDREWQRWPVTILAGAYAGWAVGKAAGGSVLKGKRVQFHEED